ncbi:hypothetical protein QTP88_023936 [Uroleucon formosanum]
MEALGGKHNMPKDSQIIVSTMKDLGIVKYDQQVLNHLLEFNYRYMTQLLDDAKAFSNLANKKNVDADDVKLAIQMAQKLAFFGPSPREINRELYKRGIDTGGSKVDSLLIHEEFIRTKEQIDTRSLRFEITGELSAQVKEGKTSEDEINSEKSLVNQFMEQMLEGLERLKTTVDKQQLTIATFSEIEDRLERELAVEKLRSTEREEQASCTFRGNPPQPSTSDISKENQICLDESQDFPENLPESRYGAD